MFIISVPFPAYIQSWCTGVHARLSNDAVLVLTGHARVCGYSVALYSYHVHGFKQGTCQLSLILFCMFVVLRLLWWPL